MIDGILFSSGGKQSQYTESFAVQIPFSSFKMNQLTIKHVTGLKSEHECQNYSRNK